MTAKSNTHSMFRPAFAISRRCIKIVHTMFYCVIGQSIDHILINVVTIVPCTALGYCRQSHTAIA